MDMANIYKVAAAGLCALADSEKGEVNSAISRKCIANSTNTHELVLNISELRNDEATVAAYLDTFLPELLSDVDGPDLCDTPRICARMFRPNELTFRCETCAVDDTCVMCKDCYNPLQHDGHNTHVTTSSGFGFCDCGDSEAFKIPLPCRKHSIVADASVTL